MKRTFWKKVLTFALSAALAVSTCVGVAAEGATEPPDTPDAPVPSGDTGTTIPVTPDNIQKYLDGENGSIDGKTLVLSAGNYEQLELGRATKHPGSNTEYYIGGISEGNKKTFEEFLAIKKSDTWSPSAYYVRNMSNVTIKAAEGATVKVAGMVGSSGHVYGYVHDYVLDKDYTGDSAYYLTHKWNNITFEGIQFTSKVDINTSSADTVIDGVTFRGCSFTTGDTVTTAGQGLRYYNEANNGNVKNLTVENCNFNNCFQGVYTQNINGVTVKNSSFKTTGHNAIAVKSGNEAVNHKAVEITGNTFAGIGDRIIRFGDVGADTQITIMNNTATNSGDGSGQVIKAQSLAGGVTYHISDNSWGEGKTVANTEFRDLIHHAETDSTCVNAGYKEYWECTVSGELYKDEQRTQKTTIVEVTKPLAPHTMNEVPAKAATTEAEGVLAHYECSVCKQWFWDAEGKNLIANHSAVVTAKLTSQTEELNSEVGKPEETFTVTAEGSATSVAVKIDTDKLMENTADTMATADSNSELKQNAVKKLADAGVTATAEEVTLILTPAVEVENVKVDEQKATITMDISLVCKVEAKAGGAVVSVAKETVPNEQIKQDTVITISVPTSWNGKSIIVRHVTKSRGVKLYSAVAADDTVTFTVPKKDGFSPFTLYIDDGATVTVQLDSETKTYNRTDVVNETALPAASKYNYAFKGWKFEGIDGQYFNMTAELFETLLDKNAVVIGSSVFEGPLSEHPEIEEAKKNGTWGVDDNKPAATAKPAAAAVTPVRTSSIPKTSDDSNLMLWVCLMGLAALGLGGALYLKKRSNK